MKLLNAIAVTSIISTLLIATSPVNAKPRNCPDVDYYQQPNSFQKERIGGLGDTMDLDIVDTVVEANGQKWYQFKVFNGRPGQSGAGWKYGWLMASQICYM